MDSREGSKAAIDTQTSNSELSITQICVSSRNVAAHRTICRQVTVWSRFAAYSSTARTASIHIALMITSFQGVTPFTYWCIANDKRTAISHLKLALDISNSHQTSAAGFSRVMLPRGLNVLFHQTKYNVNSSEYPTSMCELSHVIANFLSVHGIIESSTI